MQFYMLSQTSLAKSGSSVVEEYIPLWMSDGTTVQTSNTFATLSYLSDGSINANTSSVTSANKLHTLNSNWNPSQQFALETSIYISANGSTASITLFDLTSTPIQLTTVSTTATSMTVVRSGKFTLTPGHSYGVVLSTNNSSSTAYVTDASLVAFT